MILNTEITTHVNIIVKCINNLEQRGYKVNLIERKCDKHIKTYLVECYKNNVELFFDRPHIMVKKDNILRGVNYLNGKNVTLNYSDFVSQVLMDTLSELEIPNYLT